MAGVRIVVVEGNIGSGKTTFLDALESRGYTVFREDLAEMSPFLDSMYNGGARSSDMLQMCVGVQQLRITAAVKRLDPLTVKPDRDGHPVVFIERWIGASEEVFIKAASNCDHISITKDGVKLWRDMIKHSGVRDFPVDRYIYIRTDPEEGHRRIMERSKTRTSERDVPLEYIQRLHVLYEAFVRRLSKERPADVAIVDNSVPSSSAEEAARAMRALEL